MTSSDSASVNPSARGVEVIRAALASLPLAPGVYRMLDHAGDALYIGKAKALKKRVASYTQLARLPHRLRSMVSQTVRVEIVEARSEAEALLIEASLIKQYQPRYNILLRDDKSFPYLLLTGDHEFPRLMKHRGSQKQKGDYFGPFPSGGAANQSLALVQKAFLLRPCADSVFSNRSRPCLQYQIKRCSAPCVGKITAPAYAQQVALAKDFLSGKSREVQETFAQQMQAHSEAMEYEKAAALRDRIKALTAVQQEHHLASQLVRDADVLGFYRSGSYSCVQVFCYRHGSLYGNHAFFPKHSGEETDDAILTAFIAQFYQAHTPPGEIITSVALTEAALLASALSLQTPRKVRLHSPGRGPRTALIQHVVANAKSALERHQAARVGEAALLAQVAELFELPESPQRIEVYDNSHLSGTHALGAMIVAGPEGLQKNAYRKFNIKDTAITSGDDYAMLREVLTRRFQRLQSEDPARESWPDLVLIDGGAGQLSSALSVFADLGISDVPLVCIAKGPERTAGREQFFMPGREPFRLPEHHPVLHYLQRLRDEAHRFAIGANRTRRKVAMRASGLDAIPGIGPTRKRALLHHFGSTAAVEKATLDELRKVSGINAATAQQIFDYFHR